MLFNSFDFLLFFPVVTILYFVLPQKIRWLLLLAASCLFYMYFIPKYILILALTIVIDYFAGILIEQSVHHKRKLLAISIVANVGILVFFKYFNFFATNINELSERIGWNYSVPLLEIILPIGLSFHTFQAMSYTIEVYRGNQKAEKHFGIYALYVMYYPQLVAGPIERPQNVLHQFHEKFVFNFERFKKGLLLMLWGFFKKVVIADRLAALVNPVFDQPHNYEGISLLIAAVFFSFQIYCDFSGYSDIAIGASELMGIKLMKNFDRPYSSKSIAEFWRRWHISLSTWFKDYLYIPLGGNRNGRWKWYRNLTIVFLVSGLWHGANWTFIIWGGLHAFYQLFAIVSLNIRGKIMGALSFIRLTILSSIFQKAIVFGLVSIAWIFFRASRVSDALYILKSACLAIPVYLQSVFAQKNYLWLEPLFLNLNVKTAIVDFVIVLTAIFIMEFIHMQQQNKSVYAWLQSKNRIKRWSVYTFFILFILVFGVFHSNAEFIYFQF